MGNRIALTALCLGLTVVSTFGQTSSELKKKYGPAVEAFEIRRGVLLTAKYTGSGRVCEMVLENRYKSAQGFDLDEKLTDDLIEQLINELVPAAERGRKDSAYGWSVYLGQSLQTTYSYENVQIISAGTRGSKHRSVFIKWKSRQCE